MISSASASQWEVYDGESAVLDGIEPYASITTDYGIGTSNIQIFGPVASKLPYGTNYVYWRAGQYQYCFAYADDMELSGTTFTASEAVVVTYSTVSGYNSQATFTTATDSNFSLNAGNYLVWSDLGDYPTLYERGEVDYAKTACIILCSFGLYYLFHHMWADIRQRYL